MADKGTEKPKRKNSFFTIFTFVVAAMILFDNNLREMTGRAVGTVFDPVIGFGGDYPVTTILIAGTIMVLLTTAMRHFTTDWLEMAKKQAYMREFNKEFMKARKENNTYRIKILTEKQPEVMKAQQEMSSKQLKSMPMTMLIVIPLFAWLFNFILALEHPFYTTPWNPNVDMFGRTLFPHWILLYMAMSIPAGALVQKAMKYIAWKERWKDRHPEVHE